MSTLVILSDPSGITGRREVPLNFGATLQDNIAGAMPEGGADCELYINGVQVDPLADARLDAPPCAFDRVVVARRPAGFDPVTWGYIISAVLLVASYAAMPKPQAEVISKDSPNNRLTGQTNVARVYQAIPDVYGYRRVWPDLLQASFEEYVNNEKIVTEWLCISRGKGTVTDVKFADTPLGDGTGEGSGVDGARWWLFEPGEVPPLPPGVPGPIGAPTGPAPPGVPASYPEAKWTRLTGVTEPFAVADVNGQELTSAQPYKTVQVYGSLSGGGTKTFTSADGPQWDQIKAATLPLTSTFRFRRTWGGDRFDEPRSGTITAVSSSGGNTTITMSFSPSIGDVGYCEGIIKPSGASSFNEVGWFTLPISDATLIIFNLAFLRGLKGTVSVLVQWEKLDGSGAPISGTADSKVFDYVNDTFDQVFFTSQIEPTTGAGRYRVKFTRQNTPLADGSDVAKLETLYGARYYDFKDVPGVTVLRVQTKATAQATGFRDRRINCMWQRQVRTLVSDTLSASRNFARAMAHMWTLAGEDMAELDTTTLAEINTELGEGSPLLRFDGSFDDADLSLGDRLQRIAYTARCSFWRSGNQWTVTRDQARASHELQLDYRNLSAGGESSVSYASHLPASYDGVELEYTDEATQATKAFVRLSIASGVPLAGSPLNPLKIQLPGCATTEQAENRAQLEARRLLYQRINVSDEALADAGDLGLGTLVRWVDPNDFAGDDGLQAGEVLGIAGSLITTSEPLDWKGQTSGRMQFTGIDGRPLGAPVVVTQAPGGVVSLASVPAGLYVADADRQAGSRYAFAVGLTAAEVEAAGLYVTTRVAPGEGGKTVSIALANYDARMYAFELAYVNESGDRYVSQDGRLYVPELP